MSSSAPIDADAKAVALGRDFPDSVPTLEESDRTYLGRSAARLGFGTEGGVIHSDPAAEVSGGRSTHASEEGPNSKSE